LVPQLAWRVHTVVSGRKIAKNGICFFPFFIYKKFKSDIMLEYSKREERLEKAKIDMRIYEMQAEVSKTLAHPIRLAILHSLRDREKTVNELVEIIGVSQSNLSQHLAIMRQKQILETRRQGSNVYYRVSNPNINKACDMVRAVLLDQLRQKQELAARYQPQ
jgi:DNA-binding transcriptional ArsR family regulator